MKIIYLHQYFRKPSSSGGVRSYEFAKRLAEDGHELIVITTDIENEFSGWKVEKFENITIHWVSVKYNNSFGFISRVWAFFKFVTFSSVRILRISSDKLIATSTPLTVAIPAIIYKVFKRKPYVFEVRDVWPEVPVALGVLKNPIVVFFAEWLERKAYQMAESIIALSPDMKVSIAKRCGIKDVAVIPNAADAELFQVSNELDSDDLKLIERLNNIKGSHEKVVFYTGTFGLVNNLEYLLNLSTFSDGCLGFVIIGGGREEKYLTRRASELGVLNRFFYILPSVNKNQLRFVHDAFDISCSTVLPINALYANSANKVFDAFASGTPVLINHSGWLKRVIESCNCGLVLTEESTESNFILLKEFLYDEIRFSKAKKESLSLGVNEYSRDNLYKKFKAVVEKNEKIV